MMKFIVIRILLVVFLFISVSYAESSQPLSNLYSGEWRIFSPETIIMGKYGYDEIYIKIGVEEVDFRDPVCSKLSDLYSTCPNEKHRCACTSINYIKILFNKNLIDVNRKLYSGLLDLNRGEIRKEEDKYFLYLSGGDGAYGWAFKLEFDKSGMKDELVRIR